MDDLLKSFVMSFLLDGFNTSDFYFSFQFQHVLKMEWNSFHIGGGQLNHPLCPLTRASMAGRNTFISGENNSLRIFPR